MPDRLKGKIALVTGGGTGIGSGIARLFALEGASVVICGRTQATLDSTIERAKGTGAEIRSIRCDVSKSQQVQSMVTRTVEELGRIDVLVNNAGVGGRLKTVVELSEEEWDETFGINAKGTWLCSRSVIPEMRKSGGGSIILISSISAYRGQTLNDCYNASKAAEESMMKCMALDFAKDSIRVNSICPAWVETEKNQFAEMANDSEVQFPTGIRSYSDLVDMHPIGRLGTPEDIAWAAVYLASDESTWVTGASLMIDGGYTCK